MELNSYLTSLLTEKKLFHAYIISGERTDVSFSAAMLLATAAVCSGSGAFPACGTCKNCVKAAKGLHPDITVIRLEKDEKEISVDTIRKMRSSVIVMPNEAERSVYIIRDADTMNDSAQNAMLKILEEPPRHVVFILLAENPERLLETVRSRCETIRLLPQEQASSDPVAEEILSAAIRKDNAALLRALSSVSEDRNAVKELLLNLRRALSDRYRCSAMPYDTFISISSAVDTADKYIDANVNAGHVTGFLLASLIEQ